MFRRCLVCASLCALVFLAVSAGALPAQEKLPHPRLHAALSELVSARQELADSGTGFGGHKAKALKAVDDAITSVKLILEVKGDDFRRVERKADFYRKYKTYPHLRQVMIDLREAREELRDAKGDFRGNKERALRDINVAMEQLKEALAFASR